MGKVSLALQVICGKGVKNFSKQLKACVGARGGHFKHSQ